MSQITTKLKSVIVRGILRTINDAGGRQMCSASLLAGENKERIERIEQFGFSSSPPSGAAAVFAAVAADRQRLVCIGENHAEHKPRGKKSGESVMYDAFEQFLHFKANNLIELNAAGDLLIKAPGKVRIEGRLEVTGEIIDNCDTGGQSMSGMRKVFNGHNHNENDNGGPTDTPIQKMDGSA